MRTIISAMPIAAVAAMLLSCQSEPDAGPEQDNGPRETCTETAARIAAAPRSGYGYPLDDVLRVNQIQMEGTHNSYHIAPEEPADIRLDYTLPPLEDQLGKMGVRQFEIDLNYDTDEDRIVVMHIPFIDEGSHCRAFVDCLKIFKTWSDANPGHHPLMVWIEPKEALDGRFADLPEILDSQILSVWPRERIVAPDDVKRGYGSVKEGLQKEGWPTLGQARGKIVFVLLDKDMQRDFLTRNGTSLDCRMIFAEGSTDADTFAAVMRLDDPVGDGEEIQRLVAAGYIIRTRADGEPGPPPDDSQFQAALASGAQCISTDFPDPQTPGGYFIEMPEGAPSRCNPVSAPPECTSSAIEDPARLSPAR